MMEEWKVEPSAGGHGSQVHRSTALTMKTTVRITVLTVILVSLAVGTVAWKLYTVDPARTMVREQRRLMKNCKARLEVYHVVQGRYPVQDTGVLVPDEGPVIDLWGNQMRCRLVEGRPVITSAGLDQVFDTEDDITE